MAYETAITVKKAIEKMQKQQYVLPSIQREFVWSVNKIENLFDSLMQGYPIGTFLFWNVDKEKSRDFQFYEFLKNYHEKNSKHNKKFEPTNDEDITAILDGQQRMTSLYIALSGFYAKKKLQAYPEQNLYLDLLNPSDEVDSEYNFCFLTEDQVKAPAAAKKFYWFKCSEILSFEDKNTIYDYLENNDLSDTSRYTKEVVRFARNTLNRFHDAIYKDGTISFYLEDTKELDKVLQIFIRINSGGVKLSYSDLLLSIATAQWNEKDAREIIHEFVDDINDIGEGFTFNKDFVLKNCLVLADFKDIKFKVENFNKKNMKTIEAEWGKTSESLKLAVKLAATFGYSNKNLIAGNAIIPIAYFIYKNKCEKEILASSKWNKSRIAIREWLARALLKGTFGSQADSIYPPMRTLINANLGKFPLTEIIEFYKGKSKSISFSDDEINNILEFQYGNKITYCALTLIYPMLHSSFEFHKDHIHPISKFNKEFMIETNLPEEKINKKINSFANLQLLESTTNNEKSDTPFKEWLHKNYTDESSRNRYLDQHFINPEQSLELKDFLKFIETRQEKIKKRLKLVLGVTSRENDNT